MNAAQRSPRWWRRALLAGLLLVGGAALTQLQPSGRPSTEVARLNFLKEPRPLPDFRFEDGEGNSLSLSDFRGRVILLNVWATWCPPCRREMPMLDRLQAALGGPDFEVVALSTDRAGRAPVEGFYSALGIKHLRIYLDRNSASMRDPGILGVPITASKGDLGVIGLPTTLLIDRNGQELGRLVGPAEWDSPAMVTLIRHRIRPTSGRVMSSTAVNTP